MNYPHLAGALVRPGEDDVNEALRTYGLARDGYFLYPANFWAHKNHARALDAHARFLDRAASAALPLVLTGAEPPEGEPVAAWLKAQARGRQVKHLGYVPRAHFAALVVGARALFFPSLYEGFGMPVVEGHGVGRSRGVQRCDGPAGGRRRGRRTLSIPENPEAMAATLVRLATDDAWIADLRAAGAARAAALDGPESLGAAYVEAIRRAHAARAKRGS